MGLLCVEVTLPDHHPLAIINVYIPPRGSPYAHYIDPLMALIHSTLTRLLVTHHGDVLLAGDTNKRYGRPNGSNRYCDDNWIYDAMFRRLLNDTQTSPIFGRRPDMHAYFTSKSVKGGPASAEVDGFVGPINLPVDRVAAGPRIEFDEFTHDKAITHIPVTLDYQLRLRNTTSPVPPAARPLTPLGPYTPYYLDIKTWRAVHAAITPRLATLDHNSPALSTNALFKSISSTFIQSSIDVCPRERSSPTFSNRLFKGSQLPGHIVANLTEGRKLRKESIRLAQTDPQQSDALWHRQITICRAAVLSGKLHVAGVAKHVSNRASTERVIDFHNLVKYFKSTVFVDPANPHFGDSIPSDPAHDDALLRFFKWFRDLCLETRGVLPGTSSRWHFWQPYVHHADGSCLAENAETALFYYIIFPPTKRMTPPRCSSDPSIVCKVCDRYLAHWNAWDPSDPRSNVPVPAFHPCMRTSIAGGPDGLSPEFIRWTRPSGVDDTHSYRLTVAKLLARLFNSILRDGKVPDGDFAASVTTPVYKPPKAGKPAADVTDPESYRDISVSQLIPKILSLAWSFRFTHWAMRTGVISPEQVAFLPGHSSELHVFSATQILRSRARANLTTYAIYIDFWKAYNRVHLPSLWFLMRKMGVPDIVVSIFEDWTSKMSTRIRVNGVLSDPYEMSAGCPQGWPLSCMFYLFFIEPLIRLINGNPLITGLDVPGLDRQLKSLFFADDALGLSSDLAHTTEFIKSVVMYATDWGVRINDKPGKSEVELFEASNLTPAKDLPPIVIPAPVDAGGRAPPLSLVIATPPPSREPILSISFTDMYTYLGLALPASLDHSPATVNVTRILDCLYSRFFSYNRVVQRSCPALQLQLLGSIIVGAVVYLRSLVIIDPFMQTKIDRRIIRYARDIFGFPRSTPASIVSATGMLNCLAGIIAQQRERLCMQLNNPLSMPSIASAIYTLMLTEGPAVSNRLANMPTRASRDRDKYVALGVIPADLHPAPHMTSVESAMYCWRVTAYEWQRSARVAACVRNPPSCKGARRRSQLAPVPPPIFKRPPPEPSAHAATIYFNFNLRPDAATSGPHLSALSVISPNGSASMPALCTLLRYQVCAVARLRTGMRALNLHPWRTFRRPTASASSPEATDDPPDHVHGSHDSDSDDSDGSDDEESGPATPGAVCHAPPTHHPNPNPNNPADRRSYIAIARSCRFCHSCASLAPEDPYHVFLECTADIFPTLRRELLMDVKRFLHRLLELLQNSLRRAYPTEEDDPDISSAVLAVDAVLPNGIPQVTPELAFITYRLLWVLQWSASDIPPSPLASTLGVVFDQVTLRRAALRSVANSWMRWSLKWTLRFSSTWQRLCLAPLLPQPETLPPPPNLSPPDPIICPSTTPPAAPQQPARAEITWPTTFPRYHRKKPTHNSKSQKSSAQPAWAFPTALTDRANLAPPPARHDPSLTAAPD